MLNFRHSSAFILVRPAYRLPSKQRKAAKFCLVRSENVMTMMSVYSIARYLTFDYSLCSLYTTYLQSYITLLACWVANALI